MWTPQLLLFGMPRIHADAAPVQFSLDKALALLAYLQNALYQFTEHCGDGWSHSDRQSIARVETPAVLVDVNQFLAAMDAATHAM